tara:strand:- start:3821 stop:4594 length:774 start_codon:yes stop_codon:yes gene_type:complete
MFRKLVTFVLKFKAMNKLLNKLNTLYNERKNTFISIGIIFGLVIAFIIFKKTIWEQPEKAEILSHIAHTYIKSSDYKTAIFGDSIKKFHDLPEEIKGDSIEFTGLNGILENSKLKNTEAGRFSNYLIGICYYKLALDEKDEEAKKEYFFNAINSFDNFKSKNKSFNSRVNENIGDVFLELNQPQTAIEYYQKALKEANHNKNNNTSSKLFLLQKAAQTAKALKNNNLALKYYLEIKNDFPNANSAKDIDKYINELSN